jgi:hypothetical protein
MGSAALPVFALGAACTSIPTVRWSRLGVIFQAARSACIFLIAKHVRDYFTRCVQLCR